ncbi:MAG TPA: hypothetical protein VF541_20240 [Longimicrobium sp.]|jgi:hypothetical protein
MRMHPLLSPAVFAVALLALAPAVGAQTVPEELVRALVANGGADRPPAVIVVGGAPHEFPADAVPEGRVLGGVGGDPAASEVAVAVAQAPAVAVEAAVAKLTSEGWSSNGGRRQRGFVGPGTNAFGLVCRGTDGMTVSAAPGPNGGSYLRLSYMSAARANPCSGPAGMPRMGMGEEAPVPVLSAPPGAVALNTSNGMMMSGADTRTRLRTPRAPSELLAHYAGQLRQAGWTPSDPVAGADAAIQTFRMRGTDGKEWFGVLSAVALPASELRDLDFSVGPASQSAAP